MTPYRYKILDWTGIDRVGSFNSRSCNLQPEISNLSNFKILAETLLNGAAYNTQFMDKIAGGTRYHHQVGISAAA